MIYVAATAHSSTLNTEHNSLVVLHYTVHNDCTLNHTDDTTVHCTLHTSAHCTLHTEWTLLIHLCIAPRLNQQMVSAHLQCSHLQLSTAQGAAPVPQCIVTQSQRAFSSPPIPWKLRLVQPKTGAVGSLLMCQKLDRSAQNLNCTVYTSYGMASEAQSYTIHSSLQYYLAAAFAIVLWKCIKALF